MAKRKRKRLEVAYYIPPHVGISLLEKVGGAQDGLPVVGLEIDGICDTSTGEPLVIIIPLNDAYKLAKTIRNMKRAVDEDNQELED